MFLNSFLHIFTFVNNIDSFTEKKAKKVADIIKKFSSFLKDFSYYGFYEKSEKNHWKFICKFPEYIFKILFVENNDEWCAKLFVYWKKETKDMTSGAGKDFEYKIGPHKNFSNLIIDIRRKIENNPLIGSKLYDDNSKINMDREAIPLLLKLKKEKEKLFSVNHEYFNDLKNIYNKIKNIPEEKLLNYCRIHNVEEADKQDFLLDLQKLNKIDYYIEMKKMGHIKNLTF